MKTLFAIGALLLVVSVDCDVDDGDFIMTRRMQNPQSYPFYQDNVMASYPYRTEPAHTSGREDMDDMNAMEMLRREQPLRLPYRQEPDLFGVDKPFRRFIGNMRGGSRGLSGGIQNIISFILKIVKIILRKIGLPKFQ